MKVQVRSQYAPFNWLAVTSFLLVFAGGVFLWVHFSGILPPMEEAKNLPFIVMVPLHLWALAHLFTVMLVLLLGVIALSYPGVLRRELQVPVTWQQYKKMLVGVISMATVYFLSSILLDFNLAIMAGVELVPMLLLVGWNATLIRKLHSSKP